MPPAFNVQTPGEPVTSATGGAGSQDNTTGDNSTATQPNEPKAPAYEPKHNGGVRWVVIDTNAELVEGKAVKVGAFVGDKDEAIAEAARLNAGGLPMEAPTTNEPKVTEPAARPASAGAVDPTTLKQAVMTSEGWLCPEPAAKE